MITTLEKTKFWLNHLQVDWERAKRSDPDVVYFISFPKCGITWLRLMLCQIFIKHYDLPEDKPTILLNELTSKYSVLPKIIQTHEDSSLVNEQGNRSNAEKLFQYAWRLSYRKNKVLFLVRDPRDVVVSHYYQVTKRTENPLDFGSLSEFVRHPVYGFRRIIRFYQIWDWNRRIMRDFLIVRYEDLMTDGSATLAKILDFIEVKYIDRKLIDEVYNLSQAENMRKLEKQNQVEGMRVFNSDTNSLKVRKAKVGSYQDELTDEDIEFCNKIMKDCPKIYGYR